MKTLTQIFYRGYVIEPTSNGCPHGGYDYWPANEEPDYGEMDGEKACHGNVGFAANIDDAKDAIFEEVMLSMPQHQVTLNGRPYYFDWIEDALKFANLWNAEGFIPAVKI